MGTLSLAAKAGPPADPRRRCGVCDWVATLDDEDHATLDDLMTKALDRSSGWTVSAVHEIARAAGLTLQLPRFTDHVKRACGRG